MHRGRLLFYVKERRIIQRTLSLGGIFYEEDIDRGGKHGVPTRRMLDDRHRTGSTK
ncbi:hypothetical protein EXIGUO9Y_270031 [Exiguobacterium oxidotolerans]|uniref:Uncharacterized protein n=1 Tax=Exiguobacterium oxidotolerans TaxID=223958 RepID=A0A653IAX1_9BACL|nr:hypothetical protein EXIGUO9Y_270031 [Exiguobacterium oxidotolerans]